MIFWIILSIILIGLVLVFLEIFLIPGTTLFGVAGAIALIAGIGMMYGYYGVLYGNVCLAVTFLLVAISVIVGFNIIQSNKLAMKAEIKSKVNELDTERYQVGQVGITYTEIRPNGKAWFGDDRLEVFSTGEYIAKHTDVEIIKITKEKIFIKPHKS